MKTLRSSFKPILVVALLLTLSVTIGAFPSHGHQVRDLHRSEAIIIDHTCTDLSKIPQRWIEQAKAQHRICYGHTSHGSQPVTGMSVLMGDPSNNDLYDFNTNGAIEAGVLSLANGRPDGDLGQSGDTSWASRTRTYLNDHGSDRNVVIWSWCGGVSDNTEAGINAYLAAMSQLEADYPDVTFIYMTGHLDGSGVAGNLNVRNNQIRDYCVANNKVLFDFADIESYDPDGNYFLDRGADDDCYYHGGNWADEWCAAHPGECASCSCAHSRCLNCQLKGKAFWWMMARLAGWGGSSECGSQKTALPGTAFYGQTITYVVVIQDLVAPLSATVYLTDVVPPGLSYVLGTLTATTGTLDDTAAPTLRWSGSLAPVGQTIITYDVTVTTNTSQVITNTATITVPGYETIARTATVLVNGLRLYLPLILKGHKW